MFEITLDSDHLSVIITLNQLVIKTEFEKRWFINFNKADWIGFANHTKQLFAQQSPQEQCTEHIKDSVQAHYDRRQTEVYPKWTHTRDKSNREIQETQTESMEFCTKN